MSTIERIASVVAGCLVLVFVLAIGWRLSSNSSELTGYEAPPSQRPQPAASELSALTLDQNLGSPGSFCPSDEVDLFWTGYNAILIRFLDSLKLASSTARIALSPIVRDMQEQRQEMNTLSEPECMTPLLDITTLVMDRHIDVLLEFMGNGDDAASELGQDLDILSAEWESIAFDFQYDPVNAALAFGVQPDSEYSGLTRFQLPEGWRNVKLVGIPNTIVSVPEGWHVRKDSKSATATVVTNADNSVRLKIAPWISRELDYTGGDTMTVLNLRLHTRKINERVAIRDAGIVRHQGNTMYWAATDNIMPSSRPIQTMIVLSNAGVSRLAAYSYTGQHDFAMRDTILTIFSSIRLQQSS